MRKERSPKNPATAIRKRVDKRANQRNATGLKPPGDPALRKLLHELEVHQIELESQNYELQAARNEAETARERYTDLYDFAPVGYFALDSAGTIQMVNLTGAGLAAIERSRLVGRNFRQLISPMDRTAFTTFLTQVFASADKRSIDTELTRKDGLRRFVNIEAQSGPEDRQCRVVVVDITERKLAKNRLRENEALVSSLLEHAPVGVCVVDSSLRVVRVDQTAERLLGPVNLANPRDLMEVLIGIWPKRVTTQIVARMRQTLESGEPYQFPGFRARRRDTGVTEDYDWQIQRIPLHPGENGVVSFINDVTARHKEESVQRRLEVLAATNTMLREEIVKRKRITSSLQRTKRELAGSLEKAAKQHAQLRELARSLLIAEEQERHRISHELHDVVVQSLVGVSLQLSAIETSRMGEPERLRQRIKRAQELVSSSTDVVHGFARDLRPTVLDDLGLIPALRSLVRNFMKDTGVRARLKADIAAASLEGVESATIYRVVQAALSNVARHANAHQVDVNLRIKEGGIFFEISDNGQGFNAEKVAKKERQGRIGLLGMRERVEMIGGVFTVDSVPGSGTTVTAALPPPPRRRAKAGKGSGPT